MKKIIFIVLISSITAISYSQKIGVNTHTPQGVFHVDGSRDNPQTGMPTAIQQENDVVVSEEGKIGVGVLSPTEKLDVNGNVRVRKIKNVNTPTLETQYNRTVMVDENGNLGYKTGSPSNGWFLGAIEAKVSDRPIFRSLGYTGGTLDLGLHLSFEIPAGYEVKFVIDYNVPVFHTRGIRYLGCDLEKTYDGTTSRIDSGSRKKSFPSKYGGTIAPPVNVDRPIDYIAAHTIDVIKNTSTSVKSVRYDIKGVVENNLHGDVVFVRAGDFSTSYDAVSTYYGGTGVITIQTYLKKI